MTLFTPGAFILASGGSSTWKIDCDLLDDIDWACLAELAVTRLPSFRAVEGVPRGGLPFARALSEYAQPDGRIDLLVADDVWTTGLSIGRYLAERPGPRPDRVAVIAAFDRGVTWSGPKLAGADPVLALWTLTS